MCELYVCVCVLSMHSATLHITLPSLQTSQTLNSRFTAIEELAMGNRSPIPQPQSDTGGSFNRKLRIVGRGRGRGESVMGQGGRGRGRGRR